MVQWYYLTGVTVVYIIAECAGAVWLPFEIPGFQLRVEGLDLCDQGGILRRQASVLIFQMHRLDETTRGKNNSMRACLPWLCTD